MNVALWWDSGLLQLTMQFALILLGRHQDVQSRIIQELDQVFENQDINVTKFDLSRLEYLEAVIKETLRLYPVVAKFARRLDSDIKLIFVAWTWVTPRHPSPPVLPGALPFIGHLHLIPRDPLDMWKWEKDLHDFSLKNGGVIKILMGSYPVYILTDPEDSLVIANKCLDKSYAYNLGRDMYNRGLVTANEVTWKPHRRLLNPVFKLQVLNSFIDIFNDQARTLISKLETKVDKESFDVEPYLMSHYLKTACQTSLGLKTDDDSVIVKNYGPATKDLFNVYLTRFQRVWLHSQYIFNISSLKKKQDSLLRILGDISETIIKQRKFELNHHISLDDDIDPESDTFKPLMDQMIDLSDTQNAFTDDEIKEHLNTIITAAYDTTAKSTVRVLMVIGSHEDVQSRIFDELNEVLGDQDRDVNKLDLPKLVYLDAVVKESLRLYPPAPRIGRRLHSCVKLKHFILPATSTCVISTYGINRHPMWGADADQFRPERWLDPATLPDNPNAFASFSLGRRNCIGKAYALMTIKITIVHLIRRYRIVCKPQNIKIRCDVLQSPVSGHCISLHLRK